MMTTASSDSHLEVKSWPKYDRHLVSSHKLIGHNFMYMYYRYLNLKKKEENQTRIEMYYSFVVLNVNGSGSYI